MRVASVHGYPVKSGPGWMTMARFRPNVVVAGDLDTLLRGHEPLRTLARHRRHDGTVWFGIRLVPLAGGRIDVGDRVEVLEAGGGLP